MIDWTKPEKLKTSELLAFLDDEHETHSIGHQYTNGMSVVDGVYKEIARRLRQSTSALVPIVALLKAYRGKPRIAAAYGAVCESHDIYAGKKEVTDPGIQDPLPSYHEIMEGKVQAYERLLEDVVEDLAAVAESQTETSRESLMASVAKRAIDKINQRGD